MTQQRVDRFWTRGMFGLSPFAKDKRNLSLRQGTSADYKFEDTTLGGGPAINMPYQYTKYADIRAGGLFATSEYRSNPTRFFENAGNSGSFQTGRVYGETHSDYAQLLHLRFGMARYTGSISFFANMHDRNMAILAKNGEFTLSYRVGQATGLYVMFYVVPLAITIPLMVMSRVLKFVLQKKPSKYYYLKPAQNLYLQAVQAILDTQLIHWRMVPYTEIFGQDKVTDVTEDGNILKENMKEAYAALPDIWKSNGKFDVYKMINRYQILADYQAATIQEIYDKTDAAGFQPAIRRYLQKAKETKIMRDAITSDRMGLYEISKAYSKNPLYQMDETKDRMDQKHWEELRVRFETSGASATDIINEQQAAAASKAAAADEAAYQMANVGATGETEEGFVQTVADFWKGLVGGRDFNEQMAAELKDGGQWLSLKVNAKDNITDTFSNSTKAPEIAAAINGVTASARTIDFSTSGGNTGLPLVDTALNAVKGFIGGTLDAVALTGLLTVAHGSVVDIPEVWDNSSSSVGDVTYQLQLRSPYGNDFSLFQDIIVPMAFLFAAAVPLASGKQTHVSPFLCEAYSRGRQTVRLGMITNLTFTRGVGNMGWRADGRPMAVDVSFTIKDLSTCMTMPLIRDPGIWDDDNKYTDWMATLGAASIQDMTYGLDKITLNANKWMQSWKSRFMTGRIVSDGRSTWLAQVASNLAAASSISR